MPHVLDLARDVLVLATRSSLVGRLLSATQGLVIDYLKIQFAGLETEALVVIYLDLAGRVIASHGMSSGRAATAARYAQEVTRQARAYSAASVVCSHQRPAPCPAEPCSEDVELTRQLAVSLGAAGIRLDDHIVVRGGSIYSFRDHGRPQVVPHGQIGTDGQGNPIYDGTSTFVYVSAAYQLTPGFRPGFAIPFNVLPAASDALQFKPIYFGILDMKILEEGNFSFHADLRIYTPLGDIAQAQDVRSGIRTTQTMIYRVPGSNWTLGSVTYFRVWMYGPKGTGYRNDVEIYFSPFADYRISKTFYATLWTDVLQLGLQHGGKGGFSNLPVDLQPGVRWEVTPSFSLNPYLNFIPARLRLDTVNVGLIVNAKLL